MIPPAYVAGGPVRQPYSYSVISPHLIVLQFQHIDYIEQLVTRPEGEEMLVNFQIGLFQRDADKFFGIYMLINQVMKSVKLVIPEKPLAGLE